MNCPVNCASCRLIGRVPSRTWVAPWKLQTVERIVNRDDPDDDAGAIPVDKAVVVTERRWTRCYFDRELQLGMWILGPVVA